MTALLDVQGLDAGYGEVPVLWRVSLEVERAEIVGLLGANGAGKTTLLDAIAGLNRPAGGAVAFDGRDITQADPAERVRLGIVQVPEGRQLFPGLTVRQNLLIGAYTRTDRRAVLRRLDGVYDLFPILAERQQQLGGTLSGGEQQMCAIGCGLMAEPRLLLFDELSLGLAPVVVERIAEALRRVHEEQGLSILLVEQDLDLCLELSRRAYVLETGRIVKGGPSSGLAMDPEIRRSYLGM